MNKRNFGINFVTADLRLTTSGGLYRSAGDHDHHSTVTGQYAISTGGQFGVGGNNHRSFSISLIHLTICSKPLSLGSQTQQHLCPAVLLSCLRYDHCELAVCQQLHRDPSRKLVYL